MSRATMKRVEDLTPAEKERFGHFLAVGEASGLRAVSIGWRDRSPSSAARYQRQLKARFYKKAEAAKRRLARTGREWWPGREAWRAGGRGGERRRWMVRDAQ